MIQMFNIVVAAVAVATAAVYTKKRLNKEKIMNDMDHLEPFIDLEDFDEVCEPLTEELEEDIDPCGICQGCY